MQLRWMLYLEQGNVLSLLRGIPRGWLADGQRIEFERVASYYGPSPCALPPASDRAHPGGSRVPGDRRPRRVEVRCRIRWAPCDIGKRRDLRPRARVACRGFHGEAEVALSF